MNIDISKLLNYSQDEIEFEKQINFGQEHLKTTEIRSISIVNVSGCFKREYEDLIILNMSIKGTMVLPCSVSLVDVPHPFDIEIYEDLSKENEEYLKIDKNSVDILPLIWQNIVLEIPLKVLSPNLDRSNIKGDGWKLVDED